jgi:hypothetical protein
MSPAVYKEVRDRCHAALRKLFLCVASPIEGPAKKDYGDVDILVALEKRMVFPPTPADQTKLEGSEILALIQEALGAEHMIMEKGNCSANLAIPWPVDLLAGPDADDNDDDLIMLSGAPDAANDDDVIVLSTARDSIHDPKQKKEERLRQPDQQQQKLYIQVDVGICTSVRQLQWSLFKHAHGDLWNMVGTTIRPLGLTIDEQGLWIRIPEIEAAHRNRSKVLLTSEPTAILDFLGLDASGTQWEEPFGSADELFEYVASCRWFWVARESPELTADGVIEHKKQLKSNDRQRMRSRPVYRRWVEEFLPKCRAEGRSLVDNSEETKIQMRSIVHEEAFAHFEGVRAEYDARLRAWLVEQQNDEIWRTVIKGGVPQDLENEHRSCLVRALRKAFLPADPDEQPHPCRSVMAASMPTRLPSGLYDIQAVRDFIKDNLEVLGEIAWAAHVYKQLAEDLALEKARQLKQG